MLTVDREQSSAYQLTNTEFRRARPPRTVFNRHHQWTVDTGLQNPITHAAKPMCPIDIDIWLHRGEKFKRV